VPGVVKGERNSKRSSPSSEMCLFSRIVTPHPSSHTSPTHKQRAWGVGVFVFFFDSVFKGVLALRQKMAVRC
jgi:hypothetical protein